MTAMTSATVAVLVVLAVLAVVVGAVFPACAVLLLFMCLVFHGCAGVSTAGCGRC